MRVSWHELVSSWAQLFKGAFLLKVGPKSHWERVLPLFLPACQWVEQSWLCEWYEKSSWWKFMHWPSAPLECPLRRNSRPGAPRLGIQVNRQGAFPSEPRNFQRDPGSLDLSYRAKGMQGMCAHGCTLPFETGTTP